MEVFMSTTRNNLPGNIFEQLKKTWNNREQIKQDLTEKFNQTKATVEVTAKVLVEQGKKSPLVHEYIVPVLESEKTEKTIATIESKIGKTKWLNNLDKVRKDFIEAKVAQAKKVETSASENAAASAAETTPTESQS
jgi:hypothetical protein